VEGVVIIKEECQELRGWAESKEVGGSREGIGGMGKDDKEFRLEMKEAERKAEEITGEMERQKKTV